MAAGGRGRESGQGCHPHESRPEGHTLCSWRHGRQVCLRLLLVPLVLFSCLYCFPLPETHHLKGRCCGADAALLSCSHQTCVPVLLGSSWNSPLQADRVPVWPHLTSCLWTIWPVLFLSHDESHHQQHINNVSNMSRSHVRACLGSHLDKCHPAGIVGIRLASVCCDVIITVLW